MPLATAANALEDCAEQLRGLAAGLEQAVRDLRSAEVKVKEKLAELEARVSSNTERIDAIEENCA